MKVVLFNGYGGSYDMINTNADFRTDEDLIALVETKPESPIIKTISGGGKPIIMEIPDESTDFMIDVDEYDDNPGYGAYRYTESLYYVVNGKIHVIYH